VDSNERRGSDRKVIALPVTVSVGAAKLRSHTAEVGRRGVFVVAERPWPRRKLVSLVLTMPDGREFEVHGMVARTVTIEESQRADMPPGMGVQFYGLSRLAQERWDEFFDHTPPGAVRGHADGVAPRERAPSLVIIPTGKEPPAPGQRRSEPPPDTLPADSEDQGPPEDERQGVAPAQPVEEVDESIEELDEDLLVEEDEGPVRHDEELLVEEDEGPVRHDMDGPTVIMDLPDELREPPAEVGLPYAATHPANVAIEDVQAPTASLDPVPVAQNPEGELRTTIAPSRKGRTPPEWVVPQQGVWRPDAGRAPMVRQSAPGQTPLEWGPGGWSGGEPQEPPRRSDVAGFLPPSPLVSDDSTGTVVYRMALPTVEALLGFANTALVSKGVFVRTTQLRPQGTPAVVCIVHPMSGDEFHLPGEIVAERPARPGVAVGFHGVTDRTVADFRNFIVLGIPEEDTGINAPVEEPAFGDGDEVLTIINASSRHDAPAARDVPRENTHDVKLKDIMVVTSKGLPMLDPSSLGRTQEVSLEELFGPKGEKR
jgi:hypothetical protein